MKHSVYEILMQVSSQNIAEATQEGGQKDKNLVVGPLLIGQQVVATTARVFFEVCTQIPV